MLVHTKVFALSFALLGALTFSTPFVSAAEDQPKEPPKADNSAVNKRDRDPNEATADQSKQNKADVELAAKIRQSVVKDETLSTNAHNVKIIAIDGVVTLKGPVKNDAEKAAVEKYAVSVVGEKNVKSQIEIAP